jgi:hypothetical protein
MARGSPSRSATPASSGGGGGGDDDDKDGKLVSTEKNNNSNNDEKMDVQQAEDGGGDRPHPESRFLRVGNLTRAINAGHLKEIFAHYGRGGAS